MENFNNFFNNNLQNEMADEELARLANDNTFDILMGNVTIKELFDQDIDVPLLVDPSQEFLSNTTKMEILDGMIDYYVEVEEYEKYVDTYVEVPLKQNQFDSLVAWTFNLGPNALASSTLLKVLNAGNYEEVPAQIKRWNKANGKVLEGLVRRREAEALLFEGKEWHEV